jgi:hypothetical protein
MRRFTVCTYAKHQRSQQVTDIASRRVADTPLLDSPAIADRQASAFPALPSHVSNVLVRKEAELSVTYQERTELYIITKEVGNEDV